MAMKMGELWTQVGSLMATLMFVWAIIQQYFPYQFRGHVQRYAHKLTGFLYPYITITFPEYTGERLRRSEAFSAIQNYLASRSSIRANRMRAEAVKDSKSLILSMDDNEEVIDEFEGVQIWWTSSKTTSKNPSVSYYPSNDERRFYKLTFHRRHRDAILGSFINHIMEQGKAVEQMNRQRKLYMNNAKNDWGHKSNWRHVPFEHPANFKTLAMDPKKKQEIINDLIKFKNGKEYYEKVGKAWKRGYLLYGPPGTGKSTMIAAMANFMEYDVYDLELTSVKDNSELKKLLIEISNKAMIVIEDIDCSLDLTGQRKKKKKTEDEEETEEKKDPVKKAEKEEEKQSKVTLSGLLNFIDGIWSACGGERLIIFTTNHKEKLDEALIRRGRMDKHIEMSYCSFAAFKVLSMNYLDVEWHESYHRIDQLLKETEMTPADVAENLMPKYEGEETDECFKRMVNALERAKEEAKKKAEEEAEAAKKAEKEKREKEAKMAEKEKEEKEAAAKKEEESSIYTAENNGIKCNGVATKEAKENGHMENNQNS
ncbi:AAA-ATPase ASD, mitochondrial-like [Cucurbita pepo subsp. pepo]|uniref:AAA-ATPase ASD, mitochondrial-like n=1 Tax=Cucurbita pepo subsp. pepo TaxID=3664 RepID=UPI000C9D32E2|nr:AAA-ATPase ASD, mitochondrial-like [Cucurbita pepo subsp. pepo]